MGDGRERPRVLARRESRRPSCRPIPGGRRERDRRPADGRAALRLGRRIRSGTHNIIATHAADNGCPTGLAYTVGTFSGPATPLVALPYGTWTFKVSGASPYGGTWPTVDLDPRVSGNVVVNVDSL